MYKLIDKINNLRDSIEGKKVVGVWEAFDENKELSGVVLLFEDEGKEFGLFIDGDNWFYSDTEVENDNE